MSMQPSSATMMRKPATKEDICLVVHHQRDAHQPYPNSWLDAERLDAIETTPAIGRCAESCQGLGRAVYVHRVAWTTILPRSAAGRSCSMPWQSIVALGTCGSVASRCSPSRRRKCRTLVRASI